MSDTFDSSAREVREAVRAKYAAIAREEEEGCCETDAGSCCDDAEEEAAVNMIGEAYDTVEGYVADADLKLGCGVPTDYAGLEPGQTVVDLGSGAGLDAFVARRVVGETGRVIGVDFAPEMVEKARTNAQKLGVENVEFLEGDIEDLPLTDETADVVLSNCVLNLVPDKVQAFAEMQKVLRPSGHFCVSDVVAGGPLPDEVRRSAELYAGCVAGAIEESEYLDLLGAVGFEEVEVLSRRRIDLPEEALPDTLTDADRAALEEGGIWSVTVRGRRPVDFASVENESVESEPISSCPESAAPTPKVEVFDSPMCCSTGVCGPDPDDTLVAVNGALRWLERQGVIVERYNPASHPERFTDTPVVYDALQREGQDVLPIVLVGGEIQSRWTYPSRDEFVRMAGLEPA
ncbi:arsenite efflux transporter metallochaperone ArsD [Salinibacter grassmerensis]|uniref:arsenite efflux transporter metallochaperone ArsD n=1 Tax=Salinibacter grassmerensis TaxID=3040353 RepID=UPI0021E9AC96|nr:arsenite efflux transporter metallochaperone ArsD [Salinibacter grassmerensis]